MDRSTPLTENRGVITGSVFDSRQVDLTGANVALWQNGSLVDVQDNPQRADRGTATARIFWMDNKTYPYYTSLYRFDHLKPGQYQIIADFEGHNVSANASVDDNTIIANLTIPDHLDSMWDVPTPTPIASGTIVG